jgi:preprotein translocase subunit SecE
MKLMVVVEVIETIGELLSLNVYLVRVVTNQNTAYPQKSNHVERESMARINPFQFIQQTRAEITKVVWPTRREVLITTAMVLLLAIIAALFFSGIDAVIRLGLRSILGLF